MATGFARGFVFDALLSSSSALVREAASISVAVEGRIEVAVAVALAVGFTAGAVFAAGGGGELVIGFAAEPTGGAACVGFTLPAGAPASLAARTMGACPRPMAIPKHKGAHFLSIGSSSHA